MAIGTYSELQSAIGNWLHRTDLTDRIPEFIALAESELFRVLRVLEMEERVTDSTSTTSRYLTLPTRFIEMRRVVIESSPAHRLSYMDPTAIHRFREDAGGKPDYYSIIGSEIEFNRASDTAYTVEMSIFRRPVALSTTDTTNDVLTYHPDTYLYGALIAAEPFLVNDKRVGMWRQMYANAVSVANGSAEKGRYGDSLAMRSNVSE